MRSQRGAMRAFGSSLNPVAQDVWSLCALARPRFFMAPRTEKFVQTGVTCAYAGHPLLTKVYKTINSQNKQQINPCFYYKISLILLTDRLFVLQFYL